MAGVRPVRLPLEYIYLDGPGIQSLYAQIVDSIETSRLTTTQKGISAKAGVALRLKNLLLKLSGVEGEASAEASASRTQTEQSTRVQTTEQTLLKLRTFLTESGEGSFFTDLAAAMRRVAASGEPAFIGIRDKFNAPQFYGGAIGSDSVNAAGYLVLEKGGPALGLQ